MKISHSKVELYNQCARKFKFKYVDKLEPDKTFSPLLFGGAIDKALNYVLLRKKHNKVIYLETARAIFMKNMNKWTGQNDLVFFKGEMAPGDFVEGDEIGNQKRCWVNLCNIGNAMLATYLEEILPQFETILSVQTKRQIPNEDGDTLVLITDFTAKLKDGRVCVFDNKTSSDIKKSYGEDSVRKSQQLAIYAEFEPSRQAGYIALGKKLKKGKIEWTMVVDTIPEEQTAIAFERVDEALRGIKAEIFPKNEKSCFAYGKKCEYMGWCKYQNGSGLIQK